MSESAVLRVRTTPQTNPTPKQRYAKCAAPIDPHHAVAIAVFSGGELSATVFGANERSAALVYVRRLRSQGVLADLCWIQVGPWCEEMWTRDLARPFGVHPSRFYGSLELEPCGS